jgi:hypothetical protein
LKQTERGVEWSCTAKGLKAGKRTITATATARHGKEEKKAVAKHTVTIWMDKIPPTLTVKAPIEVIGAGPTFPIAISGTASDPSGVRSVEWGLSDAPTVEAENESGDWNQWRAAADLTG